jgi:hypothetical protein
MNTIIEYKQLVQSAIAILASAEFSLVGFVAFFVGVIAFIVADCDRWSRLMTLPSMVIASASTPWVVAERGGMARYVAPGETVVSCPIMRQSVRDSFRQGCREPKSGRFWTAIVRYDRVPTGAVPGVAYPSPSGMIRKSVRDELAETFAAGESREMAECRVSERVRAHNAHNVRVTIEEGEPPTGWVWVWLNDQREQDLALDN